jgi:hypothetical protein
MLAVVVVECAFLDAIQKVNDPFGGIGIKFLAHQIGVCGMGIYGNPPVINCVDTD